MIKRFFSSSSAQSREFAHVLRRNVKAPRQVSAGDPSNLLPRNIPEIPPYPYGESTVYKQSNRGLYGGKMLQFGHKISEYGNKHVRIFYPNVQKVTLWSEALKKKIQIRVVSEVLKTITREGGLDNYLIKDTTHRIKALGPAGWKLRFQVLRRLEEQERTRAKPIETVQGTDIYARVERDGQTFGVSAGRTKLVKTLFEAREFETTLKAFMIQQESKTFEQLLDELVAANYDISKFLVAL